MITLAVGENWQYEYGCDRKYRGAVNAKGKPHGFGCMGYYDSKGVLESLYVGEFCNSLPHGRGYVVEHKVDVKYDSRRIDSIEDVMMNAVYDECGRPCVYPVHVGDVVRENERVVETWNMKRDGIWQRGRFVQVARRNFTTLATQSIYCISSERKGADSDILQWRNYSPVAMEGIDKDGFSRDIPFNAIITPLVAGPIMVQVAEFVFTLSDSEIYDLEYRAGDTLYHIYLSLKPIVVREGVVELQEQ